MTTLIVLFSLQPGTDAKVYEEWAKTTDLPVVRGLPSVDSFGLYRVGGLFGTDSPAPYDYVEMIDVSDMTQFGADVSTDTMAKVAAEFRQFADNPVFMMTQSVEG